MKLRKLVTIVDETHQEQGRPVEPPLRRVAAAAVLENPLAGKYEEDLTLLVEEGERLGTLLASRAVDALGERPVESFGKAGIVGTDGELEHLAALLHPRMGGPVREGIGGGKAIIPSSKKRGAAGTAIDVPLHFRNAAFVRSHFDAMEVRIADAPAPNEIVLVLVLTDGGRPNPRIGGLRREEVKGDDGLR